jgi:catechol 2,3-dioxygenase-like lactoylglutathione lyase family enzyme
MPITDLNHYFIRANNLEATKRFYCEALSLEEMPRPQVPFPGYWLGRGDKVWVHMGPHGIPNHELYYPGSPPGVATDQAGVVDHIAFGAADPDDFRARLVRMKCEWWSRKLPSFNLFQIFVRDPDGLTIELNFFDVAKMPEWDETMNYDEMPRATA